MEFVSVNYGRTDCLIRVSHCQANGRIIFVSFDQQYHLMHPASKLVDNLHIICYTKL